MQSFNDILFWHENIFKVDHLKQVYLTQLPDKKHLPPQSKQKYQITPHPGEIDLKTQRLIFHSHFISSGVEMKSIGNHIADLRISTCEKW